MAYDLAAEAGAEGRGAVTRRRGPLGSTITTWTTMSGGRWVVFAWATWKLSTGWTWRNRWPATFRRRFPDCGDRIGAGFRIGPVSMSILPIQTDAEAAAPPKPFDARARPRRKPFALTSRVLAVAWLGVAWVALWAAFVADATQKGLATVGAALAISLIALILAIGNWTGAIKL